MSNAATRTTRSSALQTQLLGSSDASEVHASKLAEYDAQIALLDRLIAVAEIAAAKGCPSPRLTGNGFELPEE